MGGCVISKAIKKKESPSFLIVSLRYIGDVLVTTPLARSIKEAFPDARVEYLVFEGTETVLANNPYVDKVNTIPRGSRSLSDVARFFRKYDYAFATSPSDRTTLFAVVAGKKSAGFSNYQKKDWWKQVVVSHLFRYDDGKHVVPMISLLLKPLGVQFIPEVTLAFVQEDADFARARLPQEGYIMLHPYSRGRYKYWSAAKWGALAGLIVERYGVQPVFTVTPDAGDMEFLAEILTQAPEDCLCLPEPFTLSQLAAAIHGSVAYVGIDTVVTHIAAAVCVPTVAIFGPTLTRYWAPWPNGCSAESPFVANRGVQRRGNVTVVQKDWECVPCNKEQCAISKRGRIECLEELSAEEVAAAIDINNFHSTA